MSLWNKITDIVNPNSEEDKRKRLAQGKSANYVRNEQPVNPYVQQKVQNARYGVLANNQPRQNEFLNSIKSQKFNSYTAAAPVAKQVGTGFGLGAVRSATGLAQGVSGLYDLASPGIGTNRFSKKLDSFAKFTDETAKAENSGASYKIGQVGTDALTFGAGGAPIKALSKAPIVAKASRPFISALKPVNKVLDKGITQVAKKGATGRIAATGLKGAKSGNNLANVAAGSLYDIGAPASKGHDISPATVATSIGVNSAFGVGLPTVKGIGSEIKSAVSNKVTKSRAPRSDVAIQTQILRDMKDAEVRAKGTAKAEMKQQVFDQQRRIKSLKAQGGYIANPFFKDESGAVGRNVLPEQPKGVTKENLTLYRGANDVNAAQASPDRPIYHADTPEYAGTYGDVSSKQVTGSVLNADNIHAYDRINGDLRKAIAKRLPAEEWRKLPGIERTNIESWLNHTLEGERLSQKFNQPMPEIVKQAFDDLGIDYIRIPGDQFKGTVGKIGHQTEIIEIPKPKSGAPIEKTTAALEATPQGRQLSPPQSRLSQNQLVQSESGQLSTPPKIEQQKIVTPKTNKVTGSSEPIIPPKQNKVQTTLGQSTAPFSNQQEALVKEYADMLKSVDDGARGGQMIDNTGYREAYGTGTKRITEHSKFYQDYYARNGRKPSKEEFLKEARRQLSNGVADPYAQKTFNDLSDPEFQSLAGQVDNGALGASPLGESYQYEPLQIYRAKVRQMGGKTERQIPVKKVETNGQRVKKTNVNTGKEERFIIADDGEMRPDTNGAYRIFTNDKGELTEIRIGDEVYTSKDIGDLTNIDNYGSTVATERRNIERAFKNNPETGKRVNELVVEFQQQQATKMVERHAAFRDGLKTLQKDLGISFGIGRHKAKKVSAAIQDLGEGKRNYDSLVKEYGQPYADKLVAADKWFRLQYDTLLDEMNATLTKYGYDPVPKRADYYTHFSEPTLFQKFGLKMQEINDSIGGPLQEASPAGVRGGIPNQLAGQSEYMLPNKKFNQFALRRKGDERTANAFESFERYLNPTLNNIYMTPAITRARVMSKAIAMENDRIGQDANHVVVQMREWANHLAGKSNRIGDRQAADSKGFRQMLQVSNYVQRKVGANSIVGNFATAVIQPIVLAQTAGKAGYKNTILALIQEASTTHGKDAPIRQSEFLKRRYTNLAPTTQGKVQRSADVAGVPLRVIEQTAGRVTWQAHYNAALDKGLKGKQAIKHADIEAEKTMAGRAIGEKPELYRSKAAGFATQFQLEVNNYVQQVGKEMTPAQVAKTFVAAYGINLLIQEATGRSIGFNPIDAAVDSVEILAGDDEEKAKKVAQRWAGEITGNAPVVSSILDTVMSDDNIKKVFGTQTPIGRFGVGSPYSSFFDNTVGKVVDGKPLEAGAYLAAPFGYSQANKTYKGIKAVADGQMTDKDGKTTVEVPQTPGNFVRGALFGPSAIKEVNQYYNNIGVKKEDQKPVQNQINSKAASMGKAVYKDEEKGIIESAFNTQQARDFFAKTQDEQKDLAATDPELQGLLDQKAAMQKAFGKRDELIGFKSPAEQAAEKVKFMTEEGKKKLFNKQPDLEYQVRLAKFEKDKKDGKLTKAQELDEARGLRKEKIGGSYDKQVRDLFEVTESELGDYLATEEKGVDKKKLYDQLLAYDQALTNAGLQKYNKYKNGIARSSAKSGSGSKGKKPTFKIAQPLVSSNYGLVSNAGKKIRAKKVLTKKLK